MEKNKHKKSDSKGNKLSEQIGKGLNEKHVLKVLKARETLDSTISFKIEASTNKKLDAKALEMNVPKSFIIQELINNFLKIK